MLEFISANLATIVVALALVAIVAALIRGLVKGKASCGPCSGDCAGCGVHCVKQQNSCEYQGEIKIKRIGEDDTEHASHV